MAGAHEKVSSWVLLSDLWDIVLEDTPTYDCYEDSTQNEQTFPQLKEEEEIPMHEVADNNLGVEILLPRGNQMARSLVVEWKRVANRNAMGRPYANPILDMKQNQVEFPGGKITEFTANFIAKSMFI